MRLADFILANLEPIVAAWEVFARSINAGRHLDEIALRDHAVDILRATARDMTSPQTAAERKTKSEGNKVFPDGDALEGASDAHAADRLTLGFEMLDVMSEYRALRASVLQLWRDSHPAADDRDVDDVTRFNESIDQSLTKAVAYYAKRVDQTRDLFLAMLGHDLRNPLVAIRMAADLISLVSIDDPEIGKCGTRILRTVSMMDRMIRDLLDYTRTRLGTGIPIHPAPLDLAVLGRELVAEFRAAHPGRIIELRTDGDLNGVWDSDRIRQAVSNLIGNAVQHGSPDAPIALSIRGGESRVAIEVHNGGEPIPPGELPKIFDPWVRGAGSDPRENSYSTSVGLGLHIAREVAKSHDGGIDVRSTAEHGTSFTISLPRRSTPRPRPR